MTKEKAIRMLNYIRSIGNGESEYKNNAQSIALDMAISALEQELKTEWIPVSEGLPKKPFGCLVTVEEDDRNGKPQSVLYPEFVGYDGETWNKADGEPIPFEVIAWQPLSKPYKESESE